VIPGEMSNSTLNDAGSPLREDDEIREDDDCKSTDRLCLLNLHMADAAQVPPYPRSTANVTTNGAQTRRANPDVMPL
jgi:hypothetical protein